MIARATSLRVNMTKTSGVSMLKVKRVLKGFSQAQLADSLGISQTKFSDIERGFGYLSSGAWRKLAKILNCEVDEIVNDRNKSTYR